jgi:hypothetical protein
MGHADASICPSCLGRIEHATRCPHCGLDLTSLEVQQAWQALVVADQWIERARSRQTSSVPSEPTTASLPEHPPVAAPPQPKRSVSAGSVLLALGAGLILVAGSIFITVSWGSLGVLGRALVLLAVTALIGLLGWFVTRRGLRASAEAVWSVFLGLLTLDWFAARDQGLAGLDAWPFGVSASVWALLAIGATLVVVPLGRRRLSKELLAVSIVAGAASWFAAGSLAAEFSDESEYEFWPAVLATVAVAVAGVVLRRAGARVGWWISAAGAAFFGLFAIGFAVAEAVEHPSLRELVVDIHGLPLLVVVVAAVGTGVLVTRTRWAASAIAVAGAATLMTLPIEDASPERGGYLAVAGLVAAGAWVIGRENDWFRGARLTVALGTVGLGLASAPWVGRLLAVVAEGTSADRTEDLATRLRPDDAPEVGAWWVALVVTLGIAAALVGARRWPEPAEVGADLVAPASCVGVVGALATVAVVDLPAASIGGALVAGGAVLSVVLAGRAIGWIWVGPAVVALAPLSTLSSWPAAVIIWPAAGLVLAVVAVRTSDVVLRCAAAFAATGWGLGTVLPALELVDGDDRWTALALVAASLVGLAASLFAVRDDLTHIAAESASAALGIAGIALGSVESTLGFASVTWTIAGTGVVVLGLTSKRRTWYRWAGSGLLGVAYVLRLTASDVDVVEAYTMPFAVFLLAVGLWAMRDADGPGTVRALLPGVVLAMLPSLPLALAEPTSLRALLLGLGAALALAVGTWRRWQVPFVAGAVVLAALTLANLGPVALAVPRWTLLAVAGVVLGGAGITWEDRVRDGRVAIRYVGSMR